MSENQKQTILIVEDTETHIDILADTLHEYDISVATDGKSALEAVESEPPDLILLDIMMPGIDGYEVCRRLKSKKATKDIPVIFLTAKSSEYDEVEGFVAGAVDYITKPLSPPLIIARVQTHLRLKEANDEKMNLLNKALEQQKIAEEATKLKDKFVSLVAHDLRSPFNSILGFLQIISDDKKNPLFSKHKELIDSTITSGKGLLNMIEELLKISRLQTGKIMVKKKFFDAHLSAAYALGILKHLADKKEVQLINDIPRGTRIFVDVELFGEVVQNLVSNAIKFCSKGDRITMFLPPVSEKATFAVKDTGTGISEKILPKIFDHDEQTTTKGTAGEKGTGLGLPFSHDIMKAHEGSLRVESKEGEGSVFYAELPKVTPEILVVDDDEITRKLIKEKIKHLNLSFVDAENGKEALNFLENNTPHLILLDINMPVMDGYELLKHIRENPATKPIPVIIMTSSSSGGEREKAFELGANDFISKPLTMNDVIPRVKRFVI